MTSQKYYYEFDDKIFNSQRNVKAYIYSFTMPQRFKFDGAKLHYMIYGCCVTFVTVSVNPIDGYVTIHRFKV